MSNSNQLDLMKYLRRSGLPPSRDLSVAAR